MGKSLAWNDTTFPPLIPHTPPLHNCLVTGKKRWKRSNRILETPVLEQALDEIECLFFLGNELV